MEPAGDAPLPLPRLRRRPPIVTVVLVLACFGCLGSAFAFFNVCDGGYSLMLFGGSVAALGALIYREGAWATVIPFGIIALLLIGGGYYGFVVAGCHLL